MDDPQTHPSHRRRKWLLASLGSIVPIFLIARFAILPAILNSDSIRLTIQQELEKAADNPVKFGRLSPRGLFGLTIHLDKFTIMNPGGFSPEAMIRIKGITLRVGWLALFQQEIEVRRLEIESLLLRIERNADGKFNVKPPSSSGEVSLIRQRESPFLLVSATPPAVLLKHINAKLLKADVILANETGPVMMISDLSGRCRLEAPGSPLSLLLTNSASTSSGPQLHFEGKLTHDQQNSPPLLTAGQVQFRLTGLALERFGRFLKTGLLVPSRKAEFEFNAHFDAVDRKWIVDTGIARTDGFESITTGEFHPAAHTLNLKTVSRVEPSKFLFKEERSFDLGSFESTLKVQGPLLRPEFILEVEGKKVQLPFGLGRRIQLPAVTASVIAVMDINARNFKLQGFDLRLGQVQLRAKGDLNNIDGDPAGQFLFLCEMPLKMLLRLLPLGNFGFPAGLSPAGMLKGEYQLEFANRKYRLTGLTQTKNAGITIASLLPVKFGDGKLENLLIFDLPNNSITLAAAADSPFSRISMEGAIRLDDSPRLKIKLECLLRLGKIQNQISTWLPLASFFNLKLPVLELAGVANWDARLGIADRLPSLDSVFELTNAGWNINNSFQKESKTGFKFLINSRSTEAAYFEKTNCVLEAERFQFSGLDFQDVKGSGTIEDGEFKLTVSGRANGDGRASLSIRSRLRLSGLKNRFGLELELPLHEMGLLPGRRKGARCRAPASFDGVFDYRGFPLSFEKVWLQGAGQGTLRLGPGEILNLKAEPFLRETIQLLVIRMSQGKVNSDSLHFERLEANFNSRNGLLNIHSFELVSPELAFLRGKGTCDHSGRIFFEIDFHPRPILLEKTSESIREAFNKLGDEPMRLKVTGTRSEPAVEYRATEALLKLLKLEDKEPTPAPPVAPALPPFKLN